MADRDSWKRLFTRRQRNGAAQSLEGEMLRALMDYLPDAIYFKDTASRFIRTNKAHAKRWFHLDDPAEAVGKTDFDFFATEHALKAFEDEQRIVQTGRPLVDLEEKEIWPDGRVTWGSSTKMPFYDQTGNIVGTFGVTRDITERKEALRREQEQRRHLELLISQIRDSVVRLRAVAENILAAATQQASGASEQTAALAQVAATIDQVRAIAEQTSQRAQGVADLARETEDVSEAGRRSVGEAIEGMGQIKQKVDTIASTILALSEQTQTVGQITAAVDDIATQSNMLALNAAVEAARAGEAGKGFAVVAAEVRSLAAQSRAATVQVRDILSEIQRGVNTVVMATEEGLKGADAGVRLTGRAGEALQKLAARVLESTQAAVQIATAAHQQLVGMEQIAQVMQGIQQVTSQNLAAAQHLQQAVGELNRLAGELQDTAGRNS